MINFDRAASFYDDTRGLPDEAMTAFVDTVASALGQASRVLEIGVGTGRVAVPLSERGFEIHGIDVSAGMLEVLRAKASAVQAQVGDATALDFPDDSFDAVLAVHVFHLIEDWRTAVAEAVRVVRPGGRIVMSGIDSDDPLSAWRDRLYDTLGATATNPGGQLGQVETTLTDIGATIVHMDPVHYRVETCLHDLFDEFADGIWLRYWQLGDDERQTAAAAVRAEAVAEGMDLHETYDNHRQAQVNAAVLSGP